MIDVMLEPLVDALGEEFPIEASPRDQLRAALKYAVLAPSSHNSQPWVFRIGDDYLELFADRSRRLPIVDPNDRELVISCGAALFTLRLALRNFGIGEHTEILPDPTKPDLLARVRVRGSAAPSPIDHALFTAIRMRHTDRSAYELRGVRPELLHVFAHAADTEGAWLVTLDDAAVRGQVADLVGLADRVQMSDSGFRKELTRWLRPNATRRRDGMPGYAVGRGGFSSITGPLLIRRFDTGEGQAAKDEDLVRGSPTLAVLGTAGEHPRAWLACGQALGHLLLCA
ncbi:MAG TPA: hypothetical protein VLT79_02555, partial [Gemmatimonadales bacterium]|nr:hypothetical protein [Gemmatimonadales bacterium]